MSDARRAPRARAADSRAAASTANGSRNDEMARRPAPSDPQPCKCAAIFAETGKGGFVEGKEA